LNAADQARLRDILSRPPFSGPGPNPFLEELLQNLLEFLNRLLGGVSSGVVNASDALILLGVGIVVAIALYFLRNLRHNLVEEEIIPSVIDGPASSTSVQALEKAQRFAGAGDYRAAVRQLYLATLLLLDEGGRIPNNPSLTNREYLQEASVEPSLGAALKQIVETFERIWYGFGSMTAAEFEVYWKEVEGVRRL
jgi:uncharacterized protein DUF4129